MKKLKVLVTLGSLGIGGNEMFAMNLFRHIDKSRFTMDFVVYDKSRLDYYDEVVKGGGKVYFCETLEKGKLGILLTQRKLVIDVLKKEHYDIIHCNSCSMFGMLPGILAGRKMKIKVIAHSHNAGLESSGAAGKCVRALLKSIISHNVDYGFSCSDVAGKSKYTDSFISSEKYVVINNAIETNRYVFNQKTREEERAKLAVRSDEYLIGHVGRFEEQKNHLFLLDIFESIAQSNEKAKLVLIGTGSLLEQCREKVKRLQIEDRVIFAGQRNDVDRLYNAMDCFLLPSLFEGFPFVLVEAQINGLKCVISDTISRNVEITNGVFFMDLNAGTAQWAEKVNTCLHERLNDQEVAKVIEQYDLKNETRRIENMYVSLAEKN